MSSPAQVEFRVGLASCGVANGARPVHEAVEAAVREAGRGVARAVGCGGMCHREPLVEVVDGDGRCTVYTHVTPDLVPALVRRHLRPKGLLTRVRWMVAGLAESGNGDSAPHDAATEETTASPRIVLENCGRVDPLSLDDALAHGGYAALRACLERFTPDEVVETISASGLRGRGGAGFPTGRKWSLARAQPAPKYVICNGDEGDPGAFMDRLVLESDPHRVVEGLAIAAYAMGAAEGLFYIRAEYPQAVRRVREAIRQAEARGFLGERVLGSDLRLRFEVREGAGAFVCGEETALIASLEGSRGMPRLRPPYPVEKGYRGRPTAINNVETLACVPWIVRHGAEAFAALGTESSKGTKVFALAGKVRHGGLIEVPMGVTIREIVEDLGGGVPKGRTLKAVQLGGPSGGCLPASAGRHPGRLRGPARERRDHGLGRPGGARRPRLHGRHRPLLPALHLPRVVRQVHVLPDRHPAHARDPRPAVRGPGPRGGPREPRRARRPRLPHQPLRTRPDRAEPGADLAPLLPRGVRGPRPREALPLRALHGPHRVPDQRGRLHRLHACAPRCARWAPSPTAPTSRTPSTSTCAPGATCASRPARTPRWR